MRTVATYRLIMTYILIIIMSNSLALASTELEKIKIGDVIEIIIYGEEELTRVVKVLPDGTINFPFLQDIPVDGLLLGELRDIIVVQLSKFYVDKKPIVIINLLDTYLISVTILGQIRKPGTYQIPQNSTMQGAIGEAGGFLPGAKLKDVQLIHRQTRPDSVILVNMEKFILEANTKILPELADQDLIFIPGWPGANAVKITGEVKVPGNYEVFADLQNILDIIFKAGGATDDADLSRVLLIRPGKNGTLEKEIDIHKNIMNHKYENIPTVQPDDVIFIPKRRNYWKIFVQTMRDITGFATLYIIFRYNRKI